MTFTLDFNEFEDLLLEGLTHTEDYKRNLIQSLSFIQWRGDCEDDEFWNQMDDLIQLLSHTTSRWDEHDGCWYIRTLFTDEEIAHDSGNVVARVVRNYARTSLGDLKSKKTRELFNKATDQ